MTIFEKFKHMSSYFKSRKPKVLNSVIDANKDMRPHTPEGRIEKTKKKIAARDAKHSAIIITKSSIIQMKKDIFQFKLQEKFKKLSFRQEKNRVSKNFIAWISTIVGLSMPLIIKQKIKSKKLKKKRASFLLKQFSILSLFIGKILHKLGYIKKRMAIKVIYNQRLNTLAIYCKNWIKKRRKMQLSILTSMLDIILNNYCNAYIFDAWKSRIIFIQKNIRKAIPFKIKIYEQLLEIWRKEESAMIKSNIVMNVSLGKKNNDFNLTQHFSLISNSKRLFYIRMKIKEIVKFYSLRMQNYKSSMKMMNTGLITSNWYLAAMVKWKKSKPEKPNLIEAFSSEVMRELINQAMKDRQSMRLSINRD
ncbi:hypothetical protein SteCoe_13435 [Stentor coeruleus]|uniref:Uncharacterized protein n=1 Tax=Stentor coeruleus TaxID=5963 RepID=A0A1R2C8I9_9CILI|nr:hypothetical protein SteCoe_13435 [Stentor coeruleus]